jgi:neurotransmitter:Na+ symporter, NSS family
MSRLTWKRESGFVWSMLGSAIGFANLLSFSAQCYKNGGGAFLIPFVAAIAVLGLPMLLLEATIGHRLRLPIVSAFGRVMGNRGRLFGWLSVVAVATIGMFYIVLTGYSIAYAYFSATNAVPADSAHFFKNVFLKDSGSLSTFGSFGWPIFLSMVAVCGVSWLVLARNIRSGVEKVCSIFLPLLCSLILFFAVVVCFLPGAWMGIANYLRPDFSQLSNPALWRDVFGHVFFSFSLGLGIVTAYSRHTSESTSISRAMAYVALGDLLVSVIAGFAIFGCVGFLSQATGTPFAEIVSSDSTFEMGFVIFPKILQVFTPGLREAVGVLFFFCVFIAGITGVFSIMESIMGNVQVEFRRSRKFAASLTSAIMLLGASLFCFGNGQAIIGALAPMVLGNNMLLGGLAEIFVFLYLATGVREDPVWQRGEGKRPAYYLLRYFVPLLLATILTLSLRVELQGTLGLGGAVRWCWFVGAILLSVGLIQLARRRSIVPEVLVADAA